MAHIWRENGSTPGGKQQPTNPVEVDRLVMINFDGFFRSWPVISCVKIRMGGEK